MSCVSSVAVVAALQQAGHRVTAVGLDRSGGWHLADTTRSPLVADGPEATFEIPSGVVRTPEEMVPFDVVFPVLHGPYGEDGTIQGAFEMAGVPFVGCGVLASAVAMDKDVAKRLFTQAGLATARWEVARHDDFTSDPGGTVRRLVAAVGLPMFIKPAALGSSVGVTKALMEADVKDGLEVALGHGAKVIVEEAVVGREIEVAVLEGPRASVAGEISLGAEWYDYDAKYVDETSRFVVPARLTEPQMAEVRLAAERAFTALECTGLARVDFFFEENGRGFLINEVNTMPGFTPISGFPAMWAASGMSYEELCDELVRLALARQ